MTNENLSREELKTLIANKMVDLCTEIAKIIAMTSDNESHLLDGIDLARVFDHWQLLTLLRFKKS